MVIGFDDDRENAYRTPNRSALYLWGYNVRGQTSHVAGVNGDPRTWRCQRQPQPIPQARFRSSEGQSICLVDVACGLQHTAAVGSDGSLLTWGSNEYGQLGDGTEEDIREPHRVEALRKEIVTAVACGSHCTAAISTPRFPPKSSEEPQEGRLWVWGQNQGANLPRLFRGAFPPNTVVRQVACGASHAAALSADGLLQTWGYNEFGQLGRGFSGEGQQEPRILRAFVQHLDEGPVQVQISSVACGEYHTAAIADTTGELYTWGWGAMGQLGHRILHGGRQEVLPRRVVALEGSPLVQVACGRLHTCAVTNRGALFMWGGGQEGQLGMGPNRCHMPSRDSSGGLDHAIRRLPVAVVPKGVKQVACGQSHTLAALADGRLLGWGYNSCGQAATGRNAYAWHPTPIDWCVGKVTRLAAGGGHSAVLTQACTLKELCEFKLAEGLLAAHVPELTESVPRIVEVASRNGSDALVRFCERYRDRMLSGEDLDMDEDEERRRKPRGKLRKA